jgi:2-oxoglutarate ferredoxin oxidoreductase subunit delta
MNRVMIDVDASACKGCNICIQFCPERVFSKSKKRSASGSTLPDPAHPDLCVCCRLCERMCPDGAIDVIEAGAVKGGAA